MTHETAKTGSTPGPWRAEPMVPNADNAFYITATPDGNNSEKDVATVGPCLAKTTKANANLITAAPDLYEALDEAICLIPASQRTSLKKFGAALAKARGEAA